MKCSKHGCEMIIIKLAVGWGNESKEVCMKCKEEEMAGGKTGLTFAAQKPDWQ